MDSWWLPAGDSIQCQPLLQSLPLIHCKTDFSKDSEENHAASQTVNIIPVFYVRFGCASKITSLSHSTSLPTKRLQITSIKTLYRFFSDFNYIDLLKMTIQVSIDTKWSRSTSIHFAHLKLIRLHKLIRKKCLIRIFFLSELRMPVIASINLMGLHPDSHHFTFTCNHLETCRWYD